MIEVRGAGFHYVPGVWIFRGLTFSVPPGEVCAVLGPNGRGKTTLLKCMLGVRRPAEGRIEVAGPVGYVPQVHQTAFPYTVLDVVLMGRARKVRLFATPGRRDEAIAREALERLGMVGFAERRYPSLSGGEKQLVLVARALASRCGVLVLDEPASALDLRNQGRVLTLLRRLAGEGLTVVLTTHDPQHALHVADRVLLMMGGEGALFGPAGDVMTEGNLQRLYGVELKTVSFRARGRERRTVVPVHDD